MSKKDIALEKHAEWRGKLEVRSKVPITNDKELAVAYTPGVAKPCLEIAKDESLAYTYTGKGNTVAVITDGTAVLGLGDIGPAAAMPVMEGKCALFKTFADIDAIPICLDTKDPDEIVKTVYTISKSFGGINLEDIGAPRCFDIEKRLKAMCDIPIFHDDQHGTAIVTCAGILNALKLTGKASGNLKIAMSGAGAAGIAIAEMILKFGFGDVILCGSKGTIYEGAPYNNPAQERIAKITNRENLKGSLADAMKGADIFIGVSKPGIVSEDMVRSMAEDAIIFTMANPVPEIMPDLARDAGAAVVGTGRSDFPNQINNVLAFPGIFRGALDAGAKDITDEMMLAATRAIASVIDEKELTPEYVLPDVFDKRVVRAIRKAVMEAADR
jgi:malate dehydrogenase (oxaloacetate-decarboxylating)